MQSRQGAGTPYLLFMLSLSIFALAILGASVAFPIGQDTRAILDYADEALCALFFGDFLLSLWRAEHRWQYFCRWGWIDLLSCVPSIDYLRVGRVARVFRIFRVLRAIRSAKIIATFILKRRAQGTMLAATLIAILLIVLASIGILHFEDVPQSNIKTAEDALWWTMETITTVGYGDRFPVTTEGRVLAAGLMVAGVGIIGVYTGYIAAWFLRPEEAADTYNALKISEVATAIAAMDERTLQTLATRIDQIRAILQTRAEQ